MMLAGKIHFTQPREADRLDGLPVIAITASQWPKAQRGRRAPFAAVAAAVFLHIAALVAALTFVQVRQPSSPPEDQAITLVFQPPEASVASAPEPATPPAEAAPEPSPPPEAAQEPPPPPEAEAPPPEPEPPVAERPPLPAEPPPPPPQVKVVEPPKPVAPLPVAPKPVARAKPAVPPRVAAPSAGSTAEAPNAAAPAQPAAEPPIAPDWERALAGWLEAHKIYPELARRRGVEGSVGLRFTTDRSGRVLNVSLTRSAGSPVLDAAAEALVRDATLPPFPPAMKQAVATVNVTVRYALAK
jgi:protein TonB